MMENVKCYKDSLMGFWLILSEGTLSIFGDLIGLSEKEVVIKFTKNKGMEF